MIVGDFDHMGRPYVRGRLILPRFGVDGYVDFLIDTGADSTSIHPMDGERLRIPFERLQERIEFGGIGGSHPYYTEHAVLLFDDGTLIRVYSLPVTVAKPSESINKLPSLIGRPLLNNWRMWHDPYGNRLEIVAKNATSTIRGNVADIPSFTPR